MKKKEYTKPLIEETTIELQPVLAGSENIYRDDPTTDDNPDKENWTGDGSSDSDGDYWLAE